MRFDCASGRGFGRLTLAWLLIAAPYFPKAANYYFSSSAGDDSRSSKLAQHANTPWKTISRLNSVCGDLRPGDSILFRRGETFDGAIEVTCSGTSRSPVVFAAYGMGAPPVISGLVPLSKWVGAGKGIHKTTVDYRLQGIKMLLLDGIQQPMGRYPNSGYLTYRSHEGNNSITSDQVDRMADWTGAEVVIRKSRWVIDRSRIVSHNGGTLAYTGGSENPPTDGYGFFIQNDPRTLDAVGEWCFNPSSREMCVFLGDRTPGPGRVKVSCRDFLVIIDNRRFVTFEGLSLQGAGVSAVKVSNSQNISIRHCHIDLSATDAIDATNSANLGVENCVIDHSQNDAVNLDAGCVSATVRNNVIRNTGMLPGMGSSGTGSYQAVSVFGDSSLVESNDIDSTGYNAVYFGGNSTTVRNNRIRHFCSVKDDGAGVYVGDWRVTAGKAIIGNRISDGIGAVAGTRSGGDPPQAEGIYIDDNSSGVAIRSNSVSNCPDAGIKIHNAHDVQIEGDTLFNNRAQLLIAEDAFSSHNSVRNISCSKNIFSCNSSRQLCLDIISTADDVDSFVRMDGDRYIRPAADRQAIRLVSRIWSASSLTRNLSVVQWKVLTRSSNF